MGDAFIVVLAIFISYSIRVYFNKPDLSIDIVFDKLNPLQIIIVCVHLFSFYLMDLYNFGQLDKFVKTATKIVISILAAGLMISGIFFFFPKYVFGRQVLLIHMIVLTLFMMIWRKSIYLYLKKNSYPKTLALIGNGQIISSFIEELSRMPNNGLRAVSVCVSDQQSSTPCSFPDILNNFSCISDILDSKEFDILAYDTTHSPFTDEEIRRMLQVKYDGKAVYDLSNLYKKITGKVPISFIDGGWLLHSRGLQGEYNRPYVQLKRIIDIVLSLIVLISVSPIILLIALLIKLDSKGDIFFIQERLGMKRKPFKCAKFRTMIENAEHYSGPVWSKKEDPRVTRIGKFLRKSRLDEIPQLWNVLKGDMSFVGPRPIRKHFADKLAEIIPFYGLRFSVKPGLSGWAQVNHNYAGSEEGQLEKFQYELFYIENMSLFIDLFTIFKTFHKVLRGEGQ